MHLAFFLSVATVTAYASQFEFDAATCVDPSGYSLCNATTTSDTAACLQKNCKTDCDGSLSCFWGLEKPCLQACVCEAFVESINCALSHCWNQAYSCAYQYLIMAAGFFCPLASSIPYFPPPANATGACSCNIGAIWASTQYYNLNSPMCDQDIDTLGTCTCCMFSGGYSAAYDICPSFDVGSIPCWNYLIGSQTDATDLQGCGPSLSSAICTGSLFNIPTPMQAVHDGFFGIDKLPPQGTQMVVNNAGGLTEPISGSTLTWTFDDGSTTVTIAAASQTDTPPASSSQPASSGLAQGGASRPPNNGPATRPPDIVLLLFVALMNTLGLH